MGVRTPLSILMTISPWDVLLASMEYLGRYSTEAREVQLSLAFLGYESSGRTTGRGLEYVMLDLP